jgi:hypothetical protein|tara:strand:- start:340 stop:465 length:126 start_codon:yes stop_codon:yes gene_type:complete
MLFPFFPGFRQLVTQGCQDGTWAIMQDGDYELWLSANIFGS